MVGFQRSTKKKRRFGLIPGIHFSLPFFSLPLTLHLGYPVFDSVLVGLTMDWKGIARIVCLDRYGYLKRQNVVVFAN